MPWVVAVGVVAVLLVIGAFAESEATSGLIIGFILVLTIFSTFILMKINAMALERISLGALIIALGMLVDNAIVVIDGMSIKIKQGIDSKEAAISVVKQTAIPLLGATGVAILAFAAIGTSQDTTGEFLMSLFQVMGISLGLSWVLAITLTPLFCVQFLPKPKTGNQSDPYGGKFFRLIFFFHQSSIRFFRR